MTASVHVDSPTEGRNPATVDIDRLPTVEVVRLVVAEEATVPAAVAAALPELTAAVDLLVAALRRAVRYTSSAPALLAGWPRWTPTRSARRTGWSRGGGPRTSPPTTASWTGRTTPSPGRRWARWPDRATSWSR